MNEIRTSGPLLFTEPNSPTRVGEIINTLSEIYDIPNPSEGMQVYVRDEKKTYTITGLKEAIIGGERVPNAKVDTFEAVKSQVEEIDNNFAEMREALGDGSFVVAVANLANAVKAGAVTFDMLDGKLQLSASVVDDLETANTLMPLSANQGKVLKELIDIINGIGEGSTDKKITDAIAKLVDKAPENLDTLRELAEWIEEHGTEFAAVVADINSIKKDAILSGSLNVKPNTDNVTITYRNINGTEVSEINIPAATTENAGLMTAEDKEILNNIPVIIRGNVDVDLYSGVSNVDGKFITSDTKLWLNNDTATGSVVDVSNYRGGNFIFRRDRSQPCRFGWLKSLNNLVNNGKADLCSDILNVIAANSGSTIYSGIVPDDAAYFYCTVKVSGIDIDMQLTIENNGISLNGLITDDKTSLVAAINEVKRDVQQPTPVEINPTVGVSNVDGKFITSDTKLWLNNDTATGSVVDVSNYRGGNFIFRRDRSQPCRFGWLKSLNNLVNNGKADLCSDILNVIAANSGSTIYSGIVPDDAAYFYCTVKLNGVDIEQHLTLNSKAVSISNINMRLCGGKLVGNGLPIGSLASRDNFVNFWHTPKRVKCSSILSIDIDTKEGETYRVFAFNEYGTYIGVSNDYSVLPSGTKQVMIELYSQAEYEHGRVLSLDVEDYKGMSFLDSARATPIFLSYEVQVPLAVGSDGILNERHYDNGYVMLPPNYTSDGEPVPIAMFCHGSEGYRFSETTIPNYQAYLTYVCNSGYIVCDCNGKTDKFMIVNGSVISENDVEFCPVGIASRKGLYEAIIAHFNARHDGVYVFSKSMGGLMANLLGYLQPFKVRCVASLAPAIASIVETVRWMTTEEVDFCKSQLNINGAWPAHDQWSGTAATEGKSNILANIDKFYGFDPFFFGSDIDVADFVDEAFNYNLFQIDQPSIWEKINAAHKYLPYPLKIWGAADDTAVPFALWQMYKKMVDNTFGLCYLRVLPNGTGGHNAVDSSPLALQATVKPKYGNTEVTIPLAYAELVEWLNMW